MEKVKRDFLLKIQKRLQENIWDLEVDMRFLERQKISRPNRLEEIQNAINNAKTQKEIFREKIELIDDILKEDK